MIRRFADSAGKGHRIGGLLLFWGSALAACGPGVGPDAGPEPSVRFARPLEVYRDIELITGSADFPAVASVSTLAGPADSTLLLFGLSLPASVLRFQRDESGFSARYVVSLRAERDSQLVALVDRQETVRVPGFAETGRTEESVLFQTALVLVPGVYTLTIRVRDALSARGFQATDTVAVPTYGSDSQVVAPPISVYRAISRRDRATEPGLILNPRHTASYGGGAPLVYVETYGDAPVRLELRDGRGEPVWSRDVELEAGAGLAAGVIALPVDSIPMGRFWIRATAGDVATRPVPFLVTLSDQWLAAHFSDVLGLLRYIATEEELTGLLEAPTEERQELWDEFWRVRDPVPATPVNEYHDTFLERIRIATVQFSEPDRPGWRTDRGEVYVVLGPPSRLTELRYDDMYEGRPRAQEWVYDRLPGGRLSLVFMDRTGTGVYTLTESSEAAFRAAARRARDANRQ